MTIDLYSSTGAKKGTMTLPDVLFNAPVNLDLMHQAVVLQQSNRRTPVAHVKNRKEVHGSAKKLYQQKHTGRARRGNVRSPLLRGGGKAFGPRNNRNFTKDMPREMRHAALRSALTMQAKRSGIIGLESYPQTIKTKAFYNLLTKLPTDIGRRLLFVIPEKHDALWMSSRNIPRVKILRAAYLNPEDVLLARTIVFVGDAVEKAVEVFGRVKRAPTVKKTEKSEVPEKKSTTKKAKKSSPPSSPSSSS